MTILAIDPGPVESAYVAWNGERIINHGKAINAAVRYIVSAYPYSVVIEMIASYGMAVGKETFETCVWIGRFMEASCSGERAPAERMTRGEVKMHLCHSMKAKDANIRQALIDRFGEPGTRKNPGPTFGIVADQWAAFALAVTWMDLKNQTYPEAVPREEAVKL